MLKVEHILLNVSQEGDAWPEIFSRGRQNHVWLLHRPNGVGKQGQSSGITTLNIITDFNNCIGHKLNILGAEIWVHKSDARLDQM